jgi:hypothetical protein
MISHRFYLGASVAFGFAAHANAQPVPFACPKAGVVAEFGLGKIQYTGASPSDPTMCNRLNYKNEPDSRVFNFYPPEDSSNATIKSNLTELFSGRKASVTFDYTSPTRYLSHETWKILRREQITIGGKPVDTVVFDREALYEGRNSNHFHFVQWFDPKSGIWVKNESNVLGGQSNGMPPSYQVRSITGP